MCYGNKGIVLCLAISFSVCVWQICIFSVPGFIGCFTGGIVYLKWKYADANGHITFILGYTKTYKTFFFVFPQGFRLSIDFC